MNSLTEWLKFITSESHVLRNAPQLLFQQANVSGSILQDAQLAFVVFSIAFSLPVIKAAICIFWDFVASKITISFVLAL